MGMEGVVGGGGVGWWGVEEGPGPKAVIIFRGSFVPRVGLYDHARGTSSCQTV